ncbi:dihydroxy-acid dehydratase [Anaerobacillus isosaccharinicus]|uniref:Dihydroxy-acid dehydratase n=1 Tax=Anaerobacillus isosaccharinicus TaxID=1532552 RepID=A0A1S2M3I4_9BACI|nr:dihydroxy-acid dehydratase [Anaerobacillus isosaccharinicus]MBA5588214.1 dihydroxy-acid dehydratase [Anaerobacillus isosaccharinicus]QOY38338.1 dihydroxy-acid dehydratase [Anaerobacillus isosaccharinicus]
MENKLSEIAPFTRAILKAHLCSCGVDYKNMDKPIIAIANSWNEVVPGHVHLRELSERVKKGVREAGGLPLEFNTIAVCDGIAQGHEGMRYSLPSRETIADSVEIMVKGHGMFDGMVALSSCDKIVPGMMMAAGRLNLPSVVVLGGVMPNHIKPYESKAARKDFLAGKLDEEGLVKITNQYYPSAGACPFLGTANTMQGLSEALGMALPKTSWMQALSDEQLDAAEEAGRQVVELVKKGITPKQIMTQEAFENAISVLLAMGGSLNACLHLPAIAHEVGLELPFDLFDEISRKVPFLAGVTPNNNEYTTNDLQRAGGMPALMQELRSLLHLDAITVNGKTIGENIEGHDVLDREIIYPLEKPIDQEGGIAVLKGNLVEDGALIKQSAVSKDLLTFSGPAKVFNSEEDFVAAYEQDQIFEGDSVVIRYEGPKGGPGMRELHRCTEVLGKFERVALITDGRFSGASAGLSIGYASPEAAEGGTLALVKDGDIIEIDIPNRSINLVVSDAELAKRAENLEILKREASKYLRMYANNASSAATGGIRKL